MIRQLKTSAEVQGIPEVQRVQEVHGVQKTTARETRQVGKCTSVLVHYSYYTSIPPDVRVHSCTVAQIIIYDGTGDDGHILLKY